jgi:predicted Zn-ribbon and HTH transcriptional regulator
MLDLANEITRLRRLNESLVDRLAAASEVLSRRANRLPAQCPHCGGEISFTENAQPTTEK